MKIKYNNCMYTTRVPDDDIDWKAIDEEEDTIPVCKGVETIIFLGDDEDE